MADFYTANVQRGDLLLERGRHEEALGYFQAAMVEDAGDGYVLAQMAICQAHIKAEQATSLETIDAAIIAEPDEPDYFRLKAIILCQLKRPKEGLAVAKAGIGMAPNNPDLRSAEAHAFLCLDRWEEAENSAREALSMDADHSQASNQLVQALYERRAGAETHGLVLTLLSRRPEDAHAHYNAGYSFLQTGDCERALEHFVECLRLDPTFEPARIGLLEAMRGRYAIYRWYLRVYFAMDARAKKLKASELLFPLAIPFLGVAALLHAVASFFLLFDRRARLAMDFQDKIYGVLGGGGILLGLGLLVVGIVTGIGLMWKLGLTLIITTLFIGVELATEIPDRLRM